MYDLIYLYLEPFDSEVVLFGVKNFEAEKLTTFPIDELESALPVFCYHLDTYKVHIFGLGDFINGYIEKIKFHENLIFNNNKIEFEVN